jgi:hypothetical protein
MLEFYNYLCLDMKMLSNLVQVDSSHFAIYSRTLEVATSFDGS